MPRAAIVVLMLVMAIGACGSDALVETTAGVATTAASSETSSTTVAAATVPETTEGDSETTPTAIPAGPPFIMEGANSAYVWALQTYLDCAGFGPIDIDGMFGPGTAGSVEEAQAREGKTLTGEPDEETFAYLSRACTFHREVVFDSGATSTEVAGNVAPGDDEILGFTVLAGQQMTIDVAGDVDVTIQGADGAVLHRPNGSASISVDIATTQVYSVTVTAASPTSYSLEITIPALPPETTTTVALGADAFVLADGGFNVVDYGATPEATIAAVEAALMEMAIAVPLTDDTGWVTHDEPYCAESARTITWPIYWPSAIDAWHVDLTVFLYDEANPRFGGWIVDFRGQGDGPYPDPASLSTPFGLGIFDTLAEAEGYGFQYGGYEELSQGSVAGFTVRIPDDRVTEIANGTYMVCDALG
jgi:peptidoglycan hydrolase-like protein with peptidoglycan-binding domain